MPHPVIFFNAPRSYYRPVILHENEWYNSPAEPVESSHREHWRPPGRYDVAHHLANMPTEPFDYTDPSMVLCQWCCCESSIPTNIKAVKCPKVLLVGDTHHMPQPLTRAIRLALSEPWDLVVLEFNEHHLKWFHEAGVMNAVYIPCFTISPIDIPPPTKRTRGVVFAGNIGPDHVYRRRVLSALEARGVKIEYVTGTREECARAYNEAMVSLNISLNGDFNLRNYEIYAASGYQMADNFYNNNYTTDELADAINRVTEETSLMVGGEGREWYWATNSPEHKIAHLHHALVEANPCRGHPTDGFWTRLSIYEQVQELVMRGIMSPKDFDGLPRWSI